MLIHKVKQFSLVYIISSAVLLPFKKWKIANIHGVEWEWQWVSGGTIDRFIPWSESTDNNNRRLIWDVSQWHDRKTVGFSEQKTDSFIHSSIVQLHSCSQKLIPGKLWLVKDQRVVHHVSSDEQCSEYGNNLVGKQFTEITVVKLAYLFDWREKRYVKSL